MPHHEQKKCSRCNALFECKIGNIADCQCNEIQLSYEERAFIENKFVDCLCIDCLHVLRYEYQMHKTGNA